MLRTPFYVWYVKGNRCLLFILYSGMGVAKLANLANLAHDLAFVV